MVAVTTGGSHSLMQRACCAVIASGTATLEAAYYGLPYCLVYRLAPLSYDDGEAGGENRACRLGEYPGG